MTVPPTAHDPHTGEFTRDIERARLDAQAAELRAQGMTYRKIGEVMGCDHTTARDRVLRGIASAPVEAVNELRAVRGAQIEMLMQEALAILTTTHKRVDHGKVIEGVEDVGPKLAAIRELRALNREYRMLFGLDMPVKLDMTVTTEMEREIMALAADLKLLDPDSQSVPAVEVLP